jgi:hypothetical protein
MRKAVIVLVGTDPWVEQLQAQLAEPLVVIWQQQPQGYMNTLIDSLAALVLIDGELADWERWVIAPKVSPATRRIPMIVVSADQAVRAAAPLLGVEAVIHAEELLRDPVRIISDFARLPDPQQQAELDCACAEALPPLAQEGVRRFNAGDYYRQHDLFEEQWVNTSGAVRDLYRAVLQVGVAYYQIQRGNYRGALKMLQRSVQWLVVLPDRCQGINIARLREDSFRVRAELERLGEMRFSEFDHSLLRGVEWVEAASES